VKLCLLSLLCVAGCAPPQLARGLSVLRGSPGRYAAAIETRGGGCCSQSCAGHSVQTTLALTLAADGRADAQWSRSGCLVTITGDGPLEFPYDPGPPAALCAPRDGSVVRSLDGAGRLEGKWAREGAWMRVELHPTGMGAPWSLRCGQLVPAKGAAPFEGPVFACRFVGAPSDLTMGFEVSTIFLPRIVILDDRPGLVVRHVGGGFGQRDEITLGWSTP
jgi:hypothetical protein